MNPPRTVDVQYDTGEEQRKSSGRNEEAELKWKWHPVADVSGGIWSSSNISTKGFNL